MVPGSLGAPHDCGPCRHLAPQTSSYASTPCTSPQLHAVRAAATHVPTLMWQRPCCRRLWPVLASGPKDLLLRASAQQNAIEEHQVRHIHRELVLSTMITEQDDHRAFQAPPDQFPVLLTSHARAGMPAGPPAEPGRAGAAPVRQAEQRPQAARSRRPEAPRGAVPQVTPRHGYYIDTICNHIA